MIVAMMFGGPRDGLELCVQELTPLVFPVVSGLVEFFSAEPGAVEPPRMTTVTYVPRRDTLQDCPWCTGREGFRHQRCTYYVAGWGS